MSKLNASASEWKPNIAAAEWKPTFGGATAATATAPTAGSAAPTPSSGGSLRLTASEFIPSSSIPSTATPSTAIATTPATTTPGAVPHVQPHQAAVSSLLSLSSLTFSFETVWLLSVCCELLLRSLLRADDV
jgi:hypothetical protein